MRKNDLIKKLQSIEGNPEIVLWNGMVGDWMAIGNLQESYLCKVTAEHWIRSVENEECISRKDWNFKLPQEEIIDLKKRYRKIQYECNEFVTQEDVQQGRWKTKRIVFIDAKKRGVATYDRFGSIEY